MNLLDLQMQGLLKNVVPGHGEMRFLCFNILLYFGELLTALLNLCLPGIRVPGSDRLRQERAEHCCCIC